VNVNVNVKSIFLVNVNVNVKQITYDCANY